MPPRGRYGLTRGKLPFSQPRLLLSATNVARPKAPVMALVMLLSLLHTQTSSSQMAIFQLVGTVVLLPNRTKRTRTDS